MEKMRKELLEQERRWKKEREEMRGMIGELEWRMEKLEGEKNAGLEGDGECNDGEEAKRDGEKDGD